MELYIERLFGLVQFWLQIFWIKTFSDNAASNIWTVYKTQGFNIPTLYLVAKLLFLILLQWDFGNILSSYVDSFKTIYSRIPYTQSCQTCHSQSSVLLQCGDSFCEKCVDKHFRFSSFCPVCQLPPVSIASFSFFDGFASFASIFCCF